MKLTCIHVFWLNLECIDKLPDDYIPTACDGLKCSDMAAKGPKNFDQSLNFCDDHWDDYRVCVPSSNGMIKDYCQKSCGTCGSLLLNFVVCFDKFLTLNP